MRSNVVGGVQGTVPISNRRDKMKYKIATTSTTMRGVVPIKGATKYPEEPTIYFTREAWVKQCHLVDKCTQEVGWFAMVEHDPEKNDFTITELVIPNQEVTAAETNIGKENLADAAMELINAGKDTSKMYAWFHSHVNMGVGPSAQDEYQVEDFLDDLMDQPEVPAFIRGIQNKKGDLKLDVYYVQHGVAYQNVEFYVIHDDDPQWLLDIETEVKNKVKARVYAPAPYQHTGGFGGNRQAAGKSPNERHTYHDEYSYHGYGNIPGNVKRNDYWNDYDDYDAEANAYTTLHNTMDDDDNPFIPKGVKRSTAGMEVVYSDQTGAIDVLLDDEGQLWVSDEHCVIYSYDAYTAVYGEIGTSHKLPRLEIQ